MRVRNYTNYLVYVICAFHYISPYIYICHVVFEELYLTDGLESMRSSGSGGIINSGTAMVGGGPMFVTKN
eukprot:COSAG06_NODE_8280_length_2217_cov_1923.693107_4_plen_69_part_01